MRKQGWRARLSEETYTIPTNTLAVPLKMSWNPDEVFRLVDGGAHPSAGCSIVCPDGADRLSFCGVRTADLVRRGGAE